MPIHTTRCPNGKPPTVAELIEKLKGCPQDAYVLVRMRMGDLQAPHPRKKIVYCDQKGQLWADKKIDIDGSPKHVKAVLL